MKKEIDKLKENISKKVEEEINTLTNDVSSYMDDYERKIENEIKDSEYKMGFEFYYTILTDYYLQKNKSTSFFSEFKNYIICLLYANNISSPIYEEIVKPVATGYLESLVKFCKDNRDEIEKLDDTIKEDLLEKIDIHTRKKKNIDFSFLIAILKGTV